MMDPFGASAMKAHVVRGPELAEHFAARRQLADEVSQRAVMRFAPRFGAQMSDEV